MDPKNADQIKLDPEVTKRIKEIIAKDLSAITRDDILFLRARKSYLGKTSRDKFAGILDEKKDVKKDERKKIEPVTEEEKELNTHPAEQEEVEGEEDTDETDNVE